MEERIPTKENVIGNRERFHIFFLDSSSLSSSFQIIAVERCERKSMKEFNRQASAAVNLSFSFRTPSTA